MTKVPPLEFFALESFSSPAYFEMLRDTWGALVKHVEDSLANFMNQPPADYRSRDLSRQPDIVWGERALPNFRTTFQTLCDGYVKLSHGDLSGLNCANAPLNDFKGQSEFWCGWMTDVQESFYGELLNRAVSMASHICATEGAYWRPGDIDKAITNNGIVAVSTKLPVYKINQRIQIASGSAIMVSGIYTPDVENSCAQFLYPSVVPAPPTMTLISMRELRHPVTGEVYGETPEYERRPCIWHLVERDADAPMRPYVPD